MERVEETAKRIADILENCRFNDVFDSSGYFVIRKFNDDTERAVDVYKANYDGNAHYSICKLYEDETSDWSYTDDLSIEQLTEKLIEFYNEEFLK